MAESSSAQAGIFRALMSRAIFNVEPNEYQRAKAYLVTEKKKVNPTNKEILKAANSMIPSPEVLRSNIQAVVEYIFAKDAETESILALRREDDTTPAPKKFFKNNSRLVRDTIRKQMSHVNKGYLSDPDPAVVNLFRYNPVTKVTYVARGTPTNERDNLDIMKLLTATHIGIHRAERLLYAYFERSNDRKRVRRLGECDTGTYSTEKLVLLNNFATSLGYDKSKLPYPDLEVPKLDLVATEYIGFTYQVSGEDVSNPTTATNRVTHYANDDDNSGKDAVANNIIEEDADIATFLGGVNFNDDEEDVPIQFDHDLQIADTIGDEVRLALNLFDIEQNAAKSDAVHQEEIDSVMNKLLPTSVRQESTFQTFQRLTYQQPWIPFRAADSTRQPTLLDREGSRLFDKFLSTGLYNPHVSPGAKNGFHQLEKDWNIEATKRFQDWSTGDDCTILINRKSTQQLLQHWKKTQEIAQLKSLINKEDPSRMNIDFVMRLNRLNLPATPLAEPFRAVNYGTTAGRVPFGNPTTLNASIVGAVMDNNGNMTRQPKRHKPTKKRVFRSRMYCVTCGFAKSQHADIERQKQPWKCFRNYCAHCGDLDIYHENGMGPSCQRPRSNKCPSDWYIDK